ASGLCAVGGTARSPPAARALRGRVRLAPPASGRPGRVGPEGTLSAPRPRPPLQIEPPDLAAPLEPAPLTEPPLEPAPLTEPPLEPAPLTEPPPLPVPPPAPVVAQEPPAAGRPVTPATVRRGLVTVLL